MFVHEFLVMQLFECDVLVPKVVTHPDGQYYTYVSNAVNREYFACVSDRQISVAVKCNKEKRTDTQHFSTNEQSFEIAGEYSQVVTKIEQKYGSVETFVPFFAMHIHLAVNCHKKSEEIPNE